jgi:MHS family proline/betaine transporter-like MFS transporter
VGRKYTFLVTLVLMGGSTFLIGLVPGYEQIGLLAPIIVLMLRLIQGLALGGEYGGAATYVAEHSPLGKRGFYTSFIQTTATLGLFVSLGVILFIRQTMGVEDFTEWGWRIPFLLSAILVGISIYIRLRMQESPLFNEIKSQGKLSANPIKESFGKKENLKLVLLALFGATAGQGVVWYTGQFYALSFIQKTCQIEFVQSNYIVAIALVIGTPLFIFFGWWSDRIGRKAIMLTGMFLAVILYRPVYKHMYSLSDISNKQEVTEPKKIFESITATSAGDSIHVTKTDFLYDDQTRLTETLTEKRGAQPEIKREITLAGMNYVMLTALVLLQVVLVTMVYGPIAAFLVELFPTRIRYTSMSLPYHIGNGIFGGLTPFIATALATAGGPFAGLWYPIGVAGICFFIGLIYLPRQSNPDLR